MSQTYVEEEGGGAIRGYEISESQFRTQARTRCINYREKVLRNMREAAYSRHSPSLRRFFSLMSWRQSYEKIRD